MPLCSIYSCLAISADLSLDACMKEAPQLDESQEA